MEKMLAIFLIIFSLGALEFSVSTLSESPQDVRRIRSNGSRSFTIDYDNDVFLKDGEPFYYISGEFHYFRVPRAYWRDRLKKCKAAGLNAISTYVEWSSHEPNPGDYQFTDDNDVEHFIQLAAQEGLLVILRPGPYICGERDFGGLPSWLLTKHPNIAVRTNDADYQAEVQEWFDVLFKRFRKYLYGNGGPIILVQVENHYGNSEVCNEEHKIWLRDEFRKHIGDAAVLFTIDTPWTLERGRIAGVYATVAFGPNTNVQESFTKMRQFVPRGPLINSEFYESWLSYWGRPRARAPITKIIRTMRQMLDVKANFNFYMFVGGTNFGFKNGASYDPSRAEYLPQLTSYDYDAPVDEAGDPKPLYFAIRRVISEYRELPLVVVPKRQPKGRYGSVHLTPLGSIFNNPYNEVLWKSREPKTFEFLRVKYGYVLYETTIPNEISTPAILDVMNLRDRGTVYLDYTLVKTLDRAKNSHRIALSAQAGQTLRILVENQGRISFGNFRKDFKGLLSTPLLNKVPLENWTMIGLPLGNISWVHSMTWSKFRVTPPAVYVGDFVLPPREEPLDTYVDLSGWGKGIIFLNDFNLGRYWPSVGSQVTLYVPGCYLRAKPLKNNIVIFETEHESTNLDIVFTDKPVLDKTITARVLELWSSYVSFWKSKIVVLSEDRNTEGELKQPLLNTDQLEMRDTEKGPKSNVSYL